MPYDVSWNAKLAMTESTAKHDAKAIGPRGQCGAMATSYASAILEMVRRLEMPPQWEQSGCKISAACALRRSRNDATLNILSPVAMGTCVAFLRSASAKFMSGTTASSTNKGSKGSNALTSFLAMGALTLPWKSSPTPTFGPTAFLTALIRSTACCILPSVSMNCMRGHAFILISLNFESLRRSFASFAAASGVLLSPPHHRYTNSFSRTAPPRSLCTGTLSVLP
mmetsp:Transcript_33232/g.64751  ORF Transcript_33232/g.64751 Transcript_33232/m.64751 type:complete len:225 (-) Transcript_33232:119-793(-)